MAKLVINNTDKSGFMRYVWNDYFVNGTCTHKDQYERLSSIVAVDIIKVGGNECVEIMNQQDFPIFLTFEESNQFYQVDTVNGVAPESIIDLRTIS